MPDVVTRAISSRPWFISYSVPTLRPCMTWQGPPVTTSAAKRAAVAMMNMFMASSLGGLAPPVLSGVALGGLLDGLLGGGELLGRVSGGLGFFPDARFPLYGRDELVERFLVHCHEDLAGGGGQFL